MSSFHYRSDALHVEDVPLPAIADAVGTPAYVYSAAALRASAQAFRAGLAGIPRKHFPFAVKANANLAVLKLLSEEGFGPTSSRAARCSRRRPPACQLPASLFRAWARPTAS